MDVTIGPVEVISNKPRAKGGFMQYVITAPDADGNRRPCLIVATKARKVGEKVSIVGRTGTMDQDALFE